MAKKKLKALDKGPSFAESIGLVNIFHNEKLNFFLGLMLFALAFYFVLSFISFFTTGQADQSMIENIREGELSNENRQFSNYCGSLGAYTAYFFVKRCFGLASFMIPGFIFIVSLYLMRAYRVNLWKWFFSMALLMIWLSVMMAKFLFPFFGDSHFCPGGDHGLAICQSVEGYIGSPGLVAILLLVALAFLIYISTETVYFIRRIINPMGFLNKIKFKVVDTSTETI